MKRLFFFFLLFPALLPAQTHWPLPDTLPSGAAYIKLPVEKYNHSYHDREFIITNRADYKSLFADSVQSELPDIDFMSYELVANSFCMQCIIGCKSHPQCHRNVCMYKRAWYLLKKTPRIKITADTLDGNKCRVHYGFKSKLICNDDSSFLDLQGYCPSLKDDTIDFNKQIVVARELYLDCAASIEHDFFLDTAQHCLVWRMYTGYGGCHRMDKRYFIFSLPKPPEGYVVLFEEYTLPTEY